MKRSHVGMGILGLFLVSLMAKILGGGNPRTSPLVEEGPRERAARQVAAVGGTSPSPGPSASAEPSRASASGRDLATYLSQNYPGDWNIQKDDSGKIASIHGGEIPEAGKNAESATALARKIAPLLGVPAGQVSAAGLKTDATPRSVSYDFPQVVDGYEVFDGQMRLLARKEDGTVYMVNTELRRVEAFEPKVVYGLEEARQVLREKYAQSNPSMIEPSSTRPVIWAEGSPSELAWYFTVKLGGSTPDRLQVLVSAQSAKVVLERSLMVN